MAEVTIDLLTAIAPEYAGISQDRLAVLNSIAAIHVSDTVFGEHAAVAQAYVIAHLAKIGDTGGSGAVLSESVGDISRSYAAPAGGASDWDMTAYGREFKRLCNLIALPQGDLCIPPAEYSSEVEA